MIFKVLLLLGLVGSVHALARDCIEVERSSGLSNSFQENIAHAIHTSIDWGLPFFNPRVAAKDVLPYVLKGLSSKKVSLSFKTPNKFCVCLKTRPVTQIQVSFLHIVLLSEKFRIDTISCTSSD